MFLDMMGMVGWCENLGFVDVVYTNGFEDLYKSMYAAAKGGEILTWHSTK